jgi:23S rRNA (cytidine1920-2'-O)/16S rRNA (cytidine1409-2'-O)-methyltransferase
MSPDGTYVSRAGLKLAHALEQFHIDVTGLVAADFGCNVGGFTDCLLQQGARHVVSIDTGYGALAWKLRNDSRVTVMERTNALHAAPPPQLPSGVDLVVIDMAWTPQRLAVPAAMRWLQPQGRIISLLKPHYEAKGSPDPVERAMLQDGVLTEADAETVCRRVLAESEQWGVCLEAVTRSPITGGKSSKRRADAGNIEFLALFRPVGVASAS